MHRISSLNRLVTKSYNHKALLYSNINIFSKSTRCFSTSDSNNSSNTLKDKVSGVDIKTKYVNNTAATTTAPPPPKGSTGDKYMDMYSGEVPKDENKNEGPSITPLSRSEFCKSLLMMRKSGTLSSVNMLAKMESEASSPVYGSIVPYGLLMNTGDSNNNNKLTPIIMLKKSDEHIKHFKHFSKVSLVVYPLTPVDRPPAAYALSRVNLSGRMSPVTDAAQRPAAKEAFLKKHPGAKRMVESSDNVFYRMDITDIYHYERKGTSRVSLADFEVATPDAVTIDSRDIIETLNNDHLEAIRLICEQYGDIRIDEAFVYFVDSAGLNAIAKRKSAEEWFDVRIPYDKPFKTAKECKVGLIETINDIKHKHLN
ncbi:hypothetical protein PPL_10129 [Heterostelium album PN500]|uniref:DUF2470 domain-containing protein n=1 Tax=Heterostelium pallidum (strain ATCC 26659 / Pp 5 / PN500) TaxID=670386 RepID=D3BQE4_HETP5|nr:hypothetical protein PPL_10129 [Heterostelium album PN500]EFA76364.1 hypothetical protein PPL_10129 [Heterostelium album PN500]|eukprot:XP_020428496.1 hypothetical protein PPL_10129 [Heterostelium album PN500]